MKNDMTVGTEWKKILTFSLPIMIGQLLQQLYNAVDGIVVGQYVSQNALAAVGSCMALVMMFMAFAMGLSMGSGIMIAQYFGAKKHDELRRCASTAMLLLGAVGTVMTLVAVFGSKFLVTHVLKIEIPEIRDLAILYFWISSLGMGFQFLFNCISSILRSIGDSRATLYFLIFSAVMNLVLDLFFVVTLNWGVAGAAIATAFAHVVCMMFSLIYMMRKYPMFRFKLRELEFDPSKAKIILRLGLPAVLQQGIMSMGHLFIQRVVNGFGEHTMAAFTVGTRVDGFLFTTVFGFNSGVTTFTGQNIGAGRIDRVKTAWKRGLLMSSIVTCSASLIVYLCAGQLTGLFGVSGIAMAQSVEFIRYNCIVFPVFALNGITLAVLQGSGDVVYTTSASLTSLIIRISSTFLLAYVFQIGYTSIWLTIPIGWTVSFIMGLIRYFSGAWQKKALVRADAAKEMTESAE